MTHVNANDFSVMLNPQSKNAESVGKWMQEHIANRTDPASDAPGMPPLYGQDAVPHTMTFQSLIGSFSRAYINPDEAMRDSIQNAHLMEKDVGLLESVECRQRLTALLDWEIKPEDEKCQYQVSLAQELQRIIKRIKHFTKYRMWLMKAIWTGRSGIQHKYGYTRVNGAMRMMPTPLHQDHNGWMPVNGDKLVFRYEDSWTNDRDEGAYPHQMGIRVGTNTGKNSPRIHRDYKLEPVSDGMALFLKPYERDTFCVHKHFIEDADFHHSYFSGSIHGIGIRSKIYWEWFLKQEAFAFLMQYLERSAGGIEVWTYPMGDTKALAATQAAAREKMANGRNVIFFPKPLGDDSDSYKFEIIEPGAMGLDIMQNIIENYFGGRLKRYILGQELSTEAKATGMGSGVAEAHMDTLAQIVQFDASNLQETLTHELVRYIQQLNFPETLGWHMRLELKTQDDKTQERMEALNAAYQMGAGIAESEVFRTLGLSAPGGGEKILSMAAQNAAMAPPPMPGMDPMTGMPMDDGSGEAPPEEGGEAPPEEGGDPEAEGDYEDPMELIKSMMSQYVADMDRDKYMGQGAFNFEERLHPREAVAGGNKKPGEFAEKNHGIFGQVKQKAPSLFGSPAPHPAAPRPVAAQPRPQAPPAAKPTAQRPHIANAIRSLFAEHVARHEESKQHQEPAEGGIFGKAKATERDLPTVSPHGKFVQSKTEDEDRRDRAFAIAHGSTPSAKPVAEAKPEPRHNVGEVVGEAVGENVGTPAPEVTPEVAPEAAQPAAQPAAPPRRRMAGQGADAKAVAAPAAPAMKPVEHDEEVNDLVEHLANHDRPSVQADPPSVETVPHPSPKADAAVQEPTAKKVYRQIVPQQKSESDNGKTAYDDPEEGIGSKTAGNSWTRGRRDQFVGANMEHIDKAIRIAGKTKQVDYDSAYSEAQMGLINAARTYDPSSGYSEKNWAIDGMKKAILNLDRDGMHKITESMSGTATDDSDPMANIGAYKDEDKLANSENTRKIQDIVKTLPEHEQWIINHWLTGKDENGEDINQTKLTDWWNSKFKHINREGKDVGTSSIALRHDNLLKKLRDNKDLEAESYAKLRELVMRYYRRQLLDMQVERYERRQDRVIREAAEYTETDPSDAQITAGNYRKGRFSWNGMQIVIENPRGTVRRGVSDAGAIWRNTMQAHYGYISGTNGTDGDQIDVFMGRQPQSELVFVIHQLDSDGEFDEYKCVLGCTSKAQAKDLYLSHYPKNWKCGEIVPMTICDFKEWMSNE